MEDALKQCTRSESSSEIILDCPNLQIAQELAKNFRSLAQVYPTKAIRLTMAGKDLYPAFSLRNLSTGAYMIESKNQPSDFYRILDRIKQSEDPICLTSHQSHTCLLLNDKFEPGRLVWQPAQYLGINFLWYWRKSMDDLERLLTALKQEGKAENFTYRMMRVDGGMAQYTMDYELVEFLGETVRLSVSREWNLLQS